jgi:hypothetical protein
MQNDTSLSSTDTVIGNIYANFSMAAMRTVSYLTDVDYLAQGNADSVIGMSTIRLIIQLRVNLFTQRPSTMPLHEPVAQTGCI